MNKDELIGKVFGSWEVLEPAKPNGSVYRCKCSKCDFTHIVSKTNITSDTVCPTCPKQQKSPMADVIDLFGGILGVDASKKGEMNAAFDKLNTPEFKEVYSSLERASKSIKDVMNGSLGSSDIARKVLELEAANLKKAFSGLIEDGKITEDEARMLKTEINSTANMQKLKTVLEGMKQQQSEAKKIKIKV
jgi:hypothetical protein